MGPEFNAIEGAEGWQLSNPPILAMAPLMASLEHFDEVGMARLRRKSVALTGYLEALVQDMLAKQVTIVTPADAQARGAALSLRVHVNRDRAWAVFEGLRRRGIVPDWREPDVIRAAPVPFYNTFEEAWRFADALRAELAV
jgi:kynureninase